MTEKCSFRAGPYGGRYRHLTGPAGVGLSPRAGGTQQLPQNSKIVETYCHVGAPEEYFLMCFNSAIFEGKIAFSEFSQKTLVLKELIRQSKKH
jgi:hypothetical protein